MKPYLIISHGLLGGCRSEHFWRTIVLKISSTLHCRSAFHRRRDSDSNSNDPCADLDWVPCLKIFSNFFVENNFKNPSSSAIENMDTEEGSQSRPRDIASWPMEVSHFMLECLTGCHRSRKIGENILRKDQWQSTSNKLKERFQMTYSCEQCRNHYRMWKQRLKALCDLQKNCTLGWNAVEMRFDTPLYVWSQFKKKEQKFWKEHKVFPIHLKAAVWLGNEIANGNESIYPSKADEDDIDNIVPVEDLHDLDVNHVEVDIHAEASIPSTPVESSNRNRGRSRSAVTGNREKRKKGGADKISSPLKAISTAITDLAKNDPLTVLGKRLSVAIDAIPSINFNKRWRAKQFLLERKNLAILFLEANEEDKPKVLELYMPDSEDSNGLD
ncbi:uncharacterized protein LOC122088827 [Macadamia integrifolia]|uniref:uncharacterized protein LOC122088827 n=1 Tax=Macadamia integrifolia TaxID=60698 RepID=UPI001C4F4277|nr:uncharacterized protein LOC122088827 [Macadamia integrifolia]XP_042514091.1 uncharacterized protein LOC122088827 [Macadamia integrifolia]XP_042514092.1 uncharacterized protein LOC122088827 [Macadamia integrifolia]XP_042514093.1 uncharacterized protein LOC122088827 [Macadamia integrifolia]XP_042514094.1 uncharacterized protein LOC122088827 [Macadamia integrifolia]XP_042514096.1 uncharacterized protein LOC122088827 [Macadamia integrifolia]XP_042514097.1 uncharacterized protein LOC122088827 [